MKLLTLNFQYNSQEMSASIPEDTRAQPALGDLSIERALGVL